MGTPEINFHDQILYFFLNINNKSSQNVTFGTNNVTNKLIEEIEFGYPKANNYKIHLDRKYENINKIELISTEFVNSELLIKGSSFALAVIYTIGHVCIAMTVVTVLTGASLWEAGLVALVEPTINGVWFYILHKTWTHFND